MDEVSGGQKKGRYSGKWNAFQAERSQAWRRSQERIAGMSDAVLSAKQSLRFVSIGNGSCIATMTFFNSELESPWRCQVDSVTTRGSDGIALSFLQHEHGKVILVLEQEVTSSQKTPVRSDSADSERRYPCVLKLVLQAILRACAAWRGLHAQPFYRWQWILRKGLFVSAITRIMMNMAVRILYRGMWYYHILCLGTKDIIAELGHERRLILFHV